MISVPFVAFRVTVIEHCTLCKLWSWLSHLISLGYNWFSSLPSFLNCRMDSNEVSHIVNNCLWGWGLGTGRRLDGVEYSSEVRTGPLWLLSPSTAPTQLHLCSFYLSTEIDILNQLSFFLNCDLLSFFSFVYWSFYVL
jgi:hypothetical protein